MKDSKEKILQTFFNIFLSGVQIFYLKKWSNRGTTVWGWLNAIHARKSQIHFCLQIQCQPVNASFRVCFEKFVLQLISSRTRPLLLWLLHEFGWIAVGSDIFHWEDFRGIYGYTIHKSFHQGLTKVMRGLMFVACSTWKLWGCVPNLSQTFDCGLPSI